MEHRAQSLGRIGVEDRKGWNHRKGLYPRGLHSHAKMFGPSWQQWESWTIMEQGVLLSSSVMIKNDLIFISSIFRCSHNVNFVVVEWENLGYHTLFCLNIYYVAMHYIRTYNIYRNLPNLPDVDKVLLFLFDRSGHWRSERSADVSTVLEVVSARYVMEAIIPGDVLSLSLNLCLPLLSSS